MYKIKYSNGSETVSDSMLSVIDTPDLTTEGCEYQIFEDDKENPIYSGVIIGRFFKDNDGNFYELVPGIPKDPFIDLNKRQRMRKEMSEICQSTIFSGVDVELSTGVQHFSLTETDQLNLFGKQAQIAQGATRFEYHQDGHPCIYYSLEDMMAIIETAMQFVSYHTTYFNSLSNWINNCDEEELDQIFYGAEIPQQYISEVLADYLQAMALKSDLQKILDESEEERGEKPIEI